MKAYIEDGKAYSKHGEHYANLGEDGKWKDLNGDGYQARKGFQPPQVIGKNFEANPENIGRGERKTVSKMLDQWEREENSEPLTKKMLLRLYKTLFSRSVGELAKLKGRNDIPLGVAIILENLSNKASKAKAWNDYQQWVFGKAPEAGEMDSVKKDFDFEDMTPEEKEAYDTILRKVM